MLSLVSYIYNLRLALTLKILTVGVMVVLTLFDDIPRLDSPGRIMSLGGLASNFLLIRLYSYYFGYYVVGPEAFSYEDIDTR